MSQYEDPWKEVDGHPVDDWQQEVVNNNTRLGYAEWVAHRKEDATKDSPRVPTRYQMLMTKQQVNVLISACELFMRMRMGQLHICLDDFLPWQSGAHNRYELLRTTAERFEPLLWEPSVHHPLSISSPSLDPNAKVACDLCDVMRHRLAWDGLIDGQKPGPFKQFDKPYGWGEEPLAKIKKEDEDHYP